MPSQFFIQRNGKVIGPFSYDSVKDRIGSGKIRATDQVAKASTGPWKTISDVPALVKLLDPSPKQSTGNLTECEDCGGSMSKRAETCPHCGAPTALGASQHEQTGDFDFTDDGLNFADDPWGGSHDMADDGALPGMPPRAPKSKQLSMRPIGDGKFLCSGSYQSLFDAAQQALAMSKVKIKNASPTTGEINGNARYGINAFGMSIYARVYASGAQTTVEFTAKFSDAFDTVGAGKKKVKQISENFAQVLDSGGGSNSQLGKTHGLSGAPMQSAQVGESFKGKAITGFWFSFFGLILFGPLAIIGLIMCGQAYANINASNNQEGRGWAFAGQIVGFVAVVLWAVVFWLAL